MSDNMTNVLLVGVGGQGVVLASNIICEVALRAGFDVKKSEVHGMSQRGGVVSSHVRFGPKVYSPLIAAGASDVVLGLEAAEALRFAHEVRKGGTLIVSTQTIKPPSASERKGPRYPDDPIASAKEICAGNVVSIAAEDIALKLGNPRLSSTILLGALSTNLSIDEKTWKDTIAAMVPKKTIDLNLAAFDAGRNAVK